MDPLLTTSIEWVPPTVLEEPTLRGEADALCGEVLGSISQVVCLFGVHWGLLQANALFGFLIYGRD